MASGYYKAAFTLDDLMKGPIAAVPKTDKKVFYIITRNGSYTRVDSRDYGFPIVARLQDVTRFSGVSEVLAAIAKRYTYIRGLRGDDLQIVRVEETPAQEQRVILGETEVAPVGSTVKYAIFGEAGRTYLTAGKGSLFAFALADAQLHDTQTAALTDIMKRVSNAVLGPLSIKRVAVTAATPTLTETVLS